MARKKDAPPPLFPIKHEFIAAFENVCMQSIMTLTAIENVTTRDKSISDVGRKILMERAEALRNAFYGPVPKGK